MSKRIEIFKIYIKKLLLKHFNKPQTNSNSSARLLQRKKRNSHTALNKIPLKVRIALCLSLVLVISFIVVITSLNGPKKVNQTMITGNIVSQTSSPADFQTASPSDVQSAAPAKAQNSAPSSAQSSAPASASASAPASASASAVPLDPMKTTLKEGMTAPVVAKIQQRLMDLGYMESDQPTQYFGPITKNSIELFQRQQNLTIDGCIGSSTYSLLMSSNAQKYTVNVGDQGTDVQQLESRLCELGFMGKASDTYTADTKAAVQRFQQTNGLTADGAVGQDTREMLYSDNAKPNIYGQGQQSANILTYQKRLQQLGYLTTTPDGTYGADTINAVKRFQNLNGLIADGYLGPQTITVLSSKDAQGNALILGLNGSDVTKVQQRLNSLNYLKGVTGYYGSATADAVKAFQRRNGLTVDGTVGQQTMNLLMSGNAKKAITSSGGKPAHTSDTSISDASSIEKFISIAKSKLGCKYVLGAKGPNQFDCSGFVYWCLNQAGVKQAYMTSATWQHCTKYQRINNINDLKRGDVISFRGHVGIYLGNGEMINAGSSRAIVLISPVQSVPYWRSHFVCGFRIF